VPDIKIKQKSENLIKKFDKSLIYTEKVKDNIVNVKNKANYTEQNSTSEYAGNKIEEGINVISYKGTTSFNKYGKKAIPNAKNNIQTKKKTTNEIKRIKTVTERAKNINRIRKANALEKGTIKQAEKGIKTTFKTGKATIKQTKKGIKTTVKTGKETIKNAKRTAKRSYQIAKATAKAVAKGVKIGIKVSILAIKAIIASLKALISLLIAGGWIVVLIIVVICLIALICGSVFGIFFASEDTGSTVTVGEMQEPVTMNNVISDLNTEFMDKIKQIQNNNEYEEYEITSNRAEWKDVLAIYSVKVNGGNNESEVLTLNDEKINTLKEIFWEFNEINHWITGDKITSDMTYIEFVNAKPLTLHIEIKSKTVEEMAKKYNFNDEQMKQLAELTDERYASMWNSVIYGSSIGSNDIVVVAIAQIGNVGGQPYWSWYGFESRVEWCACWVSWCANECGYIEAGIIPKFAGCVNGVNWFKACDLWRDRGFIPKGRRYYFLWLGW